jgi:hypothetical protein
MRTPFVVETWRTGPSLFDRLPIDVPSDTFALRRIEDVLGAMPPGDLFCRGASGGPGDPMPRIANTSFASCLERRLATECISINMSNVNRHDPVFRDLLGRFVGFIAPALGLRPQDIRNPSAALFLSSPGACTCYHDDREHNFLVHLRGSKTVHAFPPRETLATEIVKACFKKRGGIHSQYRTELEAVARVFAMGPGTTLYIPRLWPHRVDNGPEISASLSLNFFTPPDMRRELMYMTNDRLRRAVMTLASKVYS